MPSTRTNRLSAGVYPAEVELRWQAPGDAAPQSRRHAVRPRPWKIQRIDGLPQDKVEPPPAVIARIEREQKLLDAAREILRDVKKR